ncbi:MAG: hypothetical protein WCG55_02290 [bacterium]
MLELQQMGFSLDPEAPLEWAVLLGLLIFCIIGRYGKDIRSGKVKASILLWIYLAKKIYLDDEGSKYKSGYNH